MLDRVVFGTGARASSRPAVVLLAFTTFVEIALFSSCVGSHSSISTTTTPSAFRSVHFKMEFDVKINFPDGTLGGLTGPVEGDFVEPDSYRVNADLVVGGVGGEPARGQIVAIGDRAWKRLRSGAEITTPGVWVATERMDPVVQTFLKLVPVGPLRQLTPDELLYTVSRLPATSDSIGGVPVLRYDVPSNLKSEFVRGAGTGFEQNFLGGGHLLHPDAFDFSIWLTLDHKRVVGYHASAKTLPKTFGGEPVPTGTELDYTVTVTLTRFNDPSVTIEPPI